VGVVSTVGYFLIQKNILNNTCPRIESTQIIEIKDNSFNPENIVIKKCSKVAFKNSTSSDHWPASNFHPTHGIYPEFDPLEGIEPGKEWSFVFDKVGKWRYHDHLFPAVRGEIQVYE